MIETKPKSLRVGTAAALATVIEGSRVDRTGGKYRAGLIRGVSVLTRGEALGHGFWCDGVMLEQCLAFMQSVTERGLKCRFTHPGLCSDGLAKKLGVFLNPSLVGDQVVADLHFNTFAHKTPEGDLAGYVMDRAAEEPEQFGTSIVFCSDWDAEDLFTDEHQQKVKTEDNELRYQFVSPDPLNVENLPHARIAELLGCDCVDDPAANPNGFFHRDLSTVKAAEQLFDFALGFSNERPQEVAFGVDPERVRQFVADYATRRGFSLKGVPMTTKKGKLAAGEQNAPADQNKPVEEQAEPGAVTCPDCGAVFMPDPVKPDGQEPMPPGEYAAQHQKYVEAFGAENGSKWFFGKLSFEAASVEHYRAQLAAKDVEITSLKAELEAAKTRLAAIANSGEKPLESSPPPAGTEGGDKKKGFETLFKRAGK